MANSRFDTNRYQPITVFIAFFTLFAVLGGPGLAEVPASGNGGDQVDRPYPVRSGWLSDHGNNLPFQSDEEIIEFLETAPIIKKKQINTGINGILKLTLKRGDLQIHAGFRTVDVNKRNVRMPDGIFYHVFRDNCRHEVAAYRLARMLGIDNVPPATFRVIDSEEGTIQIWVENAMMEKERSKKNLQPPQAASWMYQTQIMYLFDCLIFNEDRNQGNILIDESWKLWMIDHTRAFGDMKDTNGLEKIRMCDRYIYEYLKRLDPDEVESSLKGSLRPPQIAAIQTRIEKVLEHIEKLIEEKGQRAVLF